MDRNLLGILFQPNPIIFFGTCILLKLKQHNTKRLCIAPLSPLKPMVFCLQNSSYSSYVILYRYSHHRCGLSGHSLKDLKFKIPWQCTSSEVRWTGITTSTKHFSLKYKNDEPFNYNPSLTTDNRQDPTNCCGYCFTGTPKQSILPLLDNDELFYVPFLFKFNLL